MNTTEQEKIIDNAIAANYLLIEQLENKIKGKSEDEVTLYPINYNKLISDRYKTRDILLQQRVSYLFERMNKEEYDNVIQMQQLGTNPQVLRVDFQHTVKDYETLQKISYDYGISVPDILLHNNITSDDFEDLKLINGTIKIPTTINPNNNQLTEILVIGSQAGTNAWGVDWGNKIEWDDDTEDIKILSREDTLKQGLNNSFGEKGDIPGHEDYTIEIQISTDLTGELYDSMLIAQLEIKVLQDKRFKKVEDIQLIPVQGGRIAKMIVIPVNVLNPLQPIKTDIPVLNK